MAIKIPFVADVAGFLRGTSDMEDALGDVADSLDDLGRADTGTLEQDLADIGTAADKSGEDVEQLGKQFTDLSKVDTSAVEAELKEIGTTGDAAAQKLESSFKGAFDTLKAEGRTASKQTKDDIQETGHAGSATMQEFSAEAKANLSETVSSFDGSVSSGVDAIQGTFGGLVSALGPAGVVGAAVIGVGIGLARNLFEKSKEQAAEVAEAVADLTGQLIELGRTSLGADQVNDQLKTLASTAEDGKNKLQEIATTAKKAGIDYRSYARGLAGDNDAIQTSYAEVTDGLDDYWAGLYKVTQQFGIGSPEVLAYANAHRESFNALTQSQKALLKQDATLDQASATTGLYNDAVEGSIENAKDEADAISDANDALREEAGLKSDAIATELDLVEARQETNKTIKENGRNLDSNTAKGRANIRALLDLAGKVNAWADAQIEAGRSTDDVNAKMAAQRTAFIKAAEAAGYTRDQAEKLARKLGLIPRKKEITVTDNGTAKKTQEKIDGIEGKRIDLLVKPDMSQFDTSVKKHLNGKAYFVTLYARPGKAVPT